MYPRSKRGSSGFKTALFLSVTLLLGGIFFINEFGVDRSIKMVKNIAGDSVAVLRSAKTSFEVKVPTDFFYEYESRISETDGARQVFVPAGSFVMGKDEDGGSDHAPEHTIKLGAYWIDAFEVSNAFYRNCVNAGGCSVPDEINWQYNSHLFERYPVVYVTWGQALAYCEWAGKDLPTEAEWEKAARGSDGSLYPWGNERPNSLLANFGDGVGMVVFAESYPDGASQFGALNMAGNAREWIADRYNPTYYQRSPSDDPKGAADGDLRSLRGGGFNDPLDRLMSYNRFKHAPGSPGSNRGFRCVSRQVLSN